jgi:sensor histidine kinase YesM
VEATGKPIHIGISANMPSPGRVLIRVSDDGTGFGAKALVELREKLAGGGAAGEDKTARHIGLANIQNRLRMHYKDPDAGVSVRNRQGGPGAIVEIAFSAHFIAKGEEA